MLKVWKDLFKIQTDITYYYKTICVCFYYIIPTLKVLVSEKAGNAMHATVSVKHRNGANLISEYISHL